MHHIKMESFSELVVGILGRNVMVGATFLVHVSMEIGGGSSLGW